MRAVKRLSRGLEEGVLRGRLKGCVSKGKKMCARRISLAFLHQLLHQLE